jgi:hypothetical protein
LILHTPIETQGKDLKTVAEFTIGKGDRSPLVLTGARRTSRRPAKSNAYFCTAKIFPGHSTCGRFCVWKLSLGYGVGEASVVVVVSVVLPSVVAGVMVSIGVDSPDEVVVVLGSGRWISVVVAGVSAGEAAGAAVSVFCSHAARSAALARMQMYFFIGYG